VTASEPTTCDLCGKTWIYTGPEAAKVSHHALIRALEEERDGLRARIQLLADEFSDGGKHRRWAAKNVAGKIRSALDGEGK
jgi:hypothetical protein